MQAGMRSELPSGSLSFSYSPNAPARQSHDFASADPAGRATEQVAPRVHHAYAQSGSCFEQMPHVSPGYDASMTMGNYGNADGTHPDIPQSSRDSAWQSQPQQVQHQQHQQQTHYQPSHQPRFEVQGFQETSTSRPFRDSGLAANSHDYEEVVFPPSTSLDSYHGNTRHGSQFDQQPSSSIPYCHVPAETIPDSQEDTAQPRYETNWRHPHPFADTLYDQSGESAADDSILMVGGGKRGNRLDRQQQAQSHPDGRPAATHTNTPGHTRFTSPRKTRQLAPSQLSPGARVSQGQHFASFNSPTRRIDDEDDEDAEGEEDIDYLARKDDQPSPSKRARRVEQSLSEESVHSSRDLPHTSAQPLSALHSGANYSAGGQFRGNYPPEALPSAPSSQQPPSAQPSFHRAGPMHDVFSSSPLPPASGLPQASLPSSSIVPIHSSGMSMNRGEGASIPSSGQQLARNFELQQLGSSPWPLSQMHPLTQTPSKSSLPQSSLPRDDVRLDAVEQSHPKASLPYHEAVEDYSSDLDIQEVTGENADTQAILDEELPQADSEPEQTVEEKLEDKNDEDAGGAFDPALMAILASVKERKKGDSPSQALAHTFSSDAIGSKSWLQRSTSDFFASLDTAARGNDSTTREKRAIAETPERTRAESPETSDSIQASAPDESVRASSLARSGGREVRGKIGAAGAASKVRSKPSRGASDRTLEEVGTNSSVKRGLRNRDQLKLYLEVDEEDIQDEHESAAGSDVAEAPTKKTKAKPNGKNAASQKKPRKASGVAKVKGKKLAFQDDDESPLTESVEDENDASDESYEETKSEGKKNKGKGKKGNAGRASPTESLPRAPQATVPSSQEASQPTRPRKILKVPNLKRLKDFEDQVDKVMDAFGGQNMIKERIADSKKEMAVFKKETAARNKKIPTGARDLKVCPICNEKWPVRPSMELRDRAQLMLDRIHSEGLSSIERLAAVPLCKQHRAESTVIPEGIKKGWPDTLDLDELEARILDQSVWRHVSEIVDEPERGFFFAKTKDFYVQNGKKASSGLMGFQQMEREQAGYFGEIGWERIFKTLMWHFFNQGDRNRNVFVGQDKLEQISPMNPNQFITGVLLPEICCRLMVQDLEEAGKPATMEDADKLRSESNVYGVTMFSASAQEDPEESSKEEGQDDDEDYETKPRRGKARKAQAEANAKVKEISKLERQSSDGKIAKASKSGKTAQTTTMLVKEGGVLSDSD